MSRPHTEEVVHAQYQGGSYIELMFGAWIGPWKGCEVINTTDDAWSDDWEDYDLEQKVALLEAAVTEWMNSQDEDNPGWYSQYLANCPR